MSKKFLHNVYMNGPASSHKKKLGRIMVMYEAALRACMEKNLYALEQALDRLEATLDYGAWPELAMNLGSLYEHCRSMGQAGHYREAGNVLASLLKTWQKSAA